MSLQSTLISTIDKSHKRVGRGYGSGKGGHNSGRGTKGQGSRSGGKNPLWFEGGQLPIIKRMPMIRGKSKFNVLHPTAEVNVSALEKMKAEVVSLETLKLEKIIDKKFKKAKVIAGGELHRKVVIQGLKVTPAAQQAIEQAGGKVEG